MFRYLVSSGDSQVYSALTDEGGDVCGGQEDERQGEVFDEGNVEAGVAVELDVRAVEKIEACLVKSSLCLDAVLVCCCVQYIEQDMNSSAEAQHSYAPFMP